jgi:hypothetical protein
VHTKSKTEVELNFNLRQDYGSLIRRTEENNKKLKNKPNFFAAIIGFITIVLCTNGELSHSERMDFFYIGIGAAVLSYLYFLNKHKTEIASNKSAIERWHKEWELQNSYVACLYELEEEFEKKNNTNIADKVISSVDGQKSSGAGKK